MPSSYPPCPLCGGDAELDEYLHQVECTNCCMRGPSFLNEKLAKAGWERLCSLASERDRMRDACSKMNDAVCQILGKALGYPPLYPEVSDVDDGSVCVGEHVAETIAAEAAERLASMVRLPAGVTEISGDLGDGRVAVWDLGREADGWGCTIYGIVDTTGSDLDNLTLQEACDQVRAELARLEGGDDE